MRKNIMQKQFTKKKRLRKAACKELDKLIIDFKRDLGPLSKDEKLLYREVKRHLLAEEKSTTYLGSRNIFLSFAVGIISLVLAASALNSENDDNLINLFDNYFTFIKELNPNLISGSFAYLVGIVLMLFIMLIILIPVLIITMIADSPIRDTIYKLHYKIELVDYKFSQACKNNQILP